VRTVKADDGPRTRDFGLGSHGSPRYPPFALTAEKSIRLCALTGVGQEQHADPPAQRAAPGVGLVDRRRATDLNGVAKVGFRCRREMRA
jgi:hypothetical protein